jgi:hypothetical protein
MLVNITDLHSFAESVPIKVNNVEIGTLLAEYEVRAHPELRNLKVQRAYAVSVRMRLRVAEEYEFSPRTVESYRDYPAAISNSLSLNLGNNDDKSALVPFLLDYFPQTINSEISTNVASSSGVSKGDSVQRSSGSSTSETNSWEVSGNLGWFGKLVTGGISAGGGGSTTHTNSSDFSEGTTRSVDNQSSMSSSMSVKDWSVYAQVDPENRGANWLWGQEFPWNVLTYCDVIKNQSRVNLPDFVRERLVFGRQETGFHVTAPSQLSLYGLNFYATAEWLIRADKTSEIDEILKINHALKYFTASHFLEGGHLVAELKGGAHSFHYASPELNLPVLGLDPVIGRGAATGAATGFSPQEFMTHVKEDQRFRITSAANNLYVTGTGFKLPTLNNDVMSADVENKKVHFEIKFKIVDLDSPVALFIKHWKTTERGCRLRITINNNTITRCVNALDRGDGSDNLTTVLLLQKTFTTDGYFNYLTLGLNTILIEVEPDNGDIDPHHLRGSCGYALRAVAVG